MAYNINKSDGSPVTVPTGAIDNQLDIPLIGQDAINYGDDLALAFVRLLENFASSNEPSFGASRTTGQLWYDTTGPGVLKVYNGTSFETIPKDGDVVHITGNEQVGGDKTFTGTPAFNGGTSGIDAPFTVDSNFVVSELNADLLDGNEASDFALSNDVIGKETIYIPGHFWLGNSELSTGGANASTFTLGSSASDPTVSGYAFDSSSTEYIQMPWAMPKSWNEGTITFQVFWTANDASTNGVTWGLAGCAFGDGVTMGSSFGTTVTVDDANQGSPGDILVTSESSAVTIAGAPGEDNLVILLLSRDVTDPNDTMAADAILTGVKIFYTTDQPTDD